MKLEKVKVSTSATKESPAKKASFSFSFPETVQEYLDTYNEKLNFDLLESGLTRAVQNPARKHLAGMDDGLSEEEYSLAVQERIDVWKLGEKTPRAPRSNEDSAKDLASRWDTFTPEYQRVLMQALMARMKEPTENGISASAEDPSAGANTVEDEPVLRRRRS